MLCVALYFLIQVFQLLLKLYDLLFAFQLIAFFVLQFKLYQSQMNYVLDHHHQFYFFFVLTLSIVIVDFLLFLVFLG
ncbi:hypothetical protein GLOIN_2v1740523 [Rhizophagus irregularis DAOM 181602=DAOM 197198]|nr:hypothetical protein GLOIN_2v1740523 [Rhizophagus irregularis DAOM 181602=DAOM 197198]